jgi:serine/threonine protein kinase
MRSDDEEKIIAAQKEFDLMKQLDHPNVVKVADIIIVPGTVNIIMEFIDGMELFDAIAEKDQYDESDAKDLFKQIITAIAYLHSKRVCHRDIKPSNVLVCKHSNKVKITDFNISKIQL